MTTKKSVVYYILIDGDGHTAGAESEEDLMERWGSEVGSDEVGPRRMFKITLAIPLPVATELKAEVPGETPDNIELKVVHDSQEAS